MFRRNQMEIIIAVLVLGVALWWFFVREEKKPVVEDAPYKIETPPVELGKPADDRVETPAPAVTEAPAKAPAKPKPAARTAKPKAPAKTPVKAKAPAKPRATKTKPQA